MQAGAHNLTLVFSDLLVSDVPPGYSPSSPSAPTSSRSPTSDDGDRRRNSGRVHAAPGPPAVAGEDRRTTMSPL